MRVSTWLLRTPQNPLRIHRAAPAASRSSLALEDLWGISLASQGAEGAGETKVSLDLVDSPCLTWPQDYLVPAFIGWMSRTKSSLESGCSSNYCLLSPKKLVGCFKPPEKWSSDQLQLSVKTKINWNRQTEESHVWFVPHFDG